jgi:hypothetical protein
MRTALTGSIRAAEAPRICYRRWTWALIIGLVLVNGGYVLSWPVVTELTYYASTEEFIHPVTGQPVAGVTISSPEWVERLYLPLVELAYGFDIPLLSPALQTYDALCISALEPMLGELVLEPAEL